MHSYGEAHGQPRIFISHGLHDHVLPINSCSRPIASNLKSLGYNVAFHEFDGDHEIPVDIARANLRFIRA